MVTREIIWCAFAGAMLGASALSGWICGGLIY